MLNQVVLVGKLVKDIETEETNGTKKGRMTLAVTGPFKNVDGEYETDFIDCLLWNIIASNTSEYCKKGDIVGVKGRLQTRTEEDKKYTEVIAEKVTFLSSNKEEKRDE